MNKIKNAKLFLFDMDGTLYLDDNLFDFTIELLETIKAKGARYVFMTNNSAKSTEDYIKKLAKLGINATKDDFVTSAYATLLYLNKHHKGMRLYVCGTESLKEELRCGGFTVTENVDETDCIVMGNDWELNFKKLYDISYMLTTRELPYIATNPDYVCPTAFGYVPDCGSVCDMIYNATKKRPVFIGKPEPAMPLLAMEYMGCSKEETLVVGDRIYTDIKSGLNAGTLTALVMSGETTYDVLEKSPDKPDYVFESAREILNILKN